MGYRYPAARVKFRCRSCGQEFTYSTAYERAGLKPEVCAGCREVEREEEIDLMVEKLKEGRDEN